MAYAWIYIVTGLLVSLTATLLVRRARRSERGLPEGDFFIRQPKAYLVIGIICAALFGGSCAAMTALVENKTFIWWLYPIFGGFAWLGVYVMLSALRWRVDVGDDTLIYTPPLGKPISLPYGAITRIEIAGPDSRHISPYVKVFAGGKKPLFSVERTCANFGPFLAQLKSKEASFGTLRLETETRRHARLR